MTPNRHRSSRRADNTGLVCLVISDAHNVHCLEEQHLDAWWHSLDAEAKIDLYEAVLEGPPTAELDPYVAAANAALVQQVLIPRGEEVLADMRRLTRTGLALATAPGKEPA